MCTDGHVIETIAIDDWVCGVTSVDDEMFALLKRDDNQVAVYSLSDYQLLRRIHWPGLKPIAGVSDMTSCVRHKCLYASDNRCIHRYDLGSSVVSKWTVPGIPRGLSVTPGSCNLLVACSDYNEPSKLVELHANSGQLVREITLQSDIDYLQHAVQLTTGQYVVCHGVLVDAIHRVCMVDAAGRITRSYGGRWGFGVGKLKWPCHLAVDEDSQFIFVADFRNRGVVLLSPRLEFVHQFNYGVSVPWPLHFHQTTRRLFVGQEVGGVAVIQL